MKVWKSVILGAALSLGASLALPVEAADVFVDTTVDEQDFSCTNGDCSLRDALFTALAGDRIVIPAGTYTLTLGTALQLGQDQILEGADAATTIIEADTTAGTASDRVLLVSAGTATLRHLTLRHGAGQDVGGGILNSAVLNVENCVIADHQANNLGGGIFSTGTLNLTDSSVTGNIAGGNNSQNGGGGIYASGDLLSLINTPVSGNMALRGDDPKAPGTGDGGGVYLNAVPATLTASPITGNFADDAGGGVYISGGTVGFSTQTVSGNTAGTDGGGIFMFSGAAVVLNASTLSGNQAGSDGGGLTNEGGQVDLTNSTVSGNSANGDGGGIYNLDFVRLFNVTVTANVADADMDDNGVAGGIHGSPFGGDQTELGNSVLAGNTNPCPTCTASPDCRTPVAAFTSRGYNVVGDRTQCSGFVDGVAGDQVGDNAAPLDPLLAALADNGGSTQTHLPMMGSPVLDLGDPMGCEDPDGATLTTDQRGFVRPVDADGDLMAVCDIGSVEVGGVPLDPIFIDGFETGDTNRWSRVVMP
ncbi:MAG: choice-of-anchor Q domain-containing protein [Acidobacteriota bacterium]|nr:choice-of-anchor Q domain-containing protein [Acidobacteriota bacterium]